jgi:hypothetical protein
MSQFLYPPGAYSLDLIQDSNVPLGRITINNVPSTGKSANIHLRADSDPQMTREEFAAFAELFRWSPELLECAELARQQLEEVIGADSLDDCMDGVRRICATITLVLKRLNYPMSGRAHDEDGPHVLLVGTPGDGFTFWGPFSNADDAIGYAGADAQTYDQTWFVAPIHVPNTQ